VVEKLSETPQGDNSEAPKGDTSEAPQGGNGEGSQGKNPNVLEPASISCSRGLSAWLRSNHVALALSSYQTGRLYLIGVRPDGRINFHEVGIGRAMGLWGDAQRLILATENQLVRFENILAPNQRAGEADKHYVPRVSHTTGDLDIHDIVVLETGVIVFANTLYSCLSTLNNVHSFGVYWKPPFISKIAAEDRCHLNGIAVRDGKPAFVTATSRCDVVGGWRDRRDQGGCVIDVEKNKVITEKLSMPHSPRWHDGKLWVLNSGTGNLGTVNFKTGAFEPRVFLPGFVRGLAFHNNHAIIGLSLPRDGSFKGLQLDAELAKREADPWCGVQIINLSSGDVVDWIRFENTITEMLDVCVLPGVGLPSATAPTSPEINTLHTNASNAPTGA
jgi:uncharacterized protein (TIGR03032 family)